MCGGSLHTFYFSSAPIDKNRKPPTLEEFKASIRHEIDCILEIELISVDALFRKDVRNECMKEDNISNISCYKVRDYFSL